MPLEGFAELTGQGTVQGWAWDSDAPEVPVQVEVVDGAAHYRRVVADLFHEPLKLTGKRDGHCRFEAPVPEAATPGSATVHVLLDGTAHCLPMPPAEATQPLWNWLDGDGAPLRPAVLVHRLCQDLLDRPATEAQLARFSGRTDSRTDLVRLVRDILEDAPGAGLLTTRDVVRHAYLGVLGRQVDPIGLANFGGALRDGMSVSDMIRGLVDSPEFKAQAGPQEEPALLGELAKVARTLQAAVTTLTLHALAPPASTAPRPAGPAGTPTDT